MSLFPAYSIDPEDSLNTKVCNSLWECTSGSISVQDNMPGLELSLAQETQLLASDSDRENSEKAATENDTARSCASQQSEDYYWDHKWDYGNLRVSTLYYPGRPQYDRAKGRRPLGARRGGDGAPRRRHRYFENAAAPPAHDEQLAARTDAWRRLLDDSPADRRLWLRFIHFQERWRGAAAALAAAREADARAPARCVRAALHRARALAAPHHQRLDALRRDLAAATSPALLTELWLRLLAALGEGASGDELHSAAAAAVRATRALPEAYPHVLYAYGAQLRAAGLWERLVLLLELVTSMNFPPAGFPPRADAASLAASEAELQAAEDAARASGLPLGVVWARVERLRAAAHWRPAPALDSDPQRAPQAADVAELLLPLRDADAAFSLLVNALRLAQVPLLPCAGHVARAADAAADARGDEAQAGCAGVLLAMVRAARRLPPAHPARAAPRDARALLARALDPPHRFAGRRGDCYLAWETALWDACLRWTAGERREALLCWRLRWLHALLLVLDPRDDGDAAEARRIRGEARAALKRYADGSPPAFAQFARIESAASGPAAATGVALHALRAALRDPACSAARRLYVARVAGEVSGDERGAAAQWARACAALGLDLPPDAELARAPPAALLADALRTCEERCGELERERDGPEEGAAEWSGAAACAALLPGAAEWAAGRAALAPAERRAALLRELRARAVDCEGATALRYWEQSACALVLSAAREHRLSETARALAPLFEHNALLALACGGAPLWAWERGAGAEERWAALDSGRTHVAALARALPALLRGEPARVERVARRSARAGAGGALLALLRLDAAPHAPGTRIDAALYDALQAHPNHKWLYVRGAALCGGEAAALADALLERALRVHALPDELAPLPDRPLQ